jgi:hypothetical protein
MVEKRKPTDDELRNFSRHLLYEIEMFSEIVAVLAALIEMPDSNPQRAMRNGLMESWALHLRNLLSFLYDTRPGKGDAVAAHFVGSGWAATRGPKPDVLRLAHAKASKEMAHLSYLRAELAEADRAWHAAPIIHAILTPLHAFLDAVPASLVIDGFHERARRAVPQNTIPLNAHGQQVIAGATQSLMAFRTRD